MQNIKIGKNVIDNLTTGMYEDSRIVYREYIQNSTDAIDKAIKLGICGKNEKTYIKIQIDQENRVITILDNGIGIAKKDIHNKLANIADSDKEKGVEKGFRGIGRLGGLAYCDELRFITSSKGEGIKTIMIWNAKECKRLVEDKNIKLSAEEIFEKIIKYEEEECDIDEHFFSVELHNISKDNNDLLNEDKVKNYIQWNAPVDYNGKFIYRHEVTAYAEKIGAPICNYNIEFQDGDVYKDYGTILYVKPSQANNKSKYDQIYGVQFKEFRNENGELLAWMWYGISAFEKQIPVVNDMRAIRLRKENIQIGNDKTLIKFFKEERGNYYFIGEVHAVHKELIPNARRDYFNENEIRNKFEAELKYYFEDVLHKLYGEGNKTKNAFKREIHFKQKEMEYEDLGKKGFVNEKEQEKIEQELEEARKEYEKGKKDILKIKEKSAGNKAIEKVISIIEEKHKKTIKDLNLELENDETNKKEEFNSKNEKNSKKVISSDLHRLNNKERKLVSKIYGIINDVLPSELSRNLIEKIQEELNK